MRSTVTPRLRLALLTGGGLLVGGAAEAPAQTRLADDHPKVATSRKVYDDLVRAFGDHRTPPGLRLVPATVRGADRVAWYEPEPHRLSLEERAYDLCVEQGADSLAALAFLLGHELAHFYERHDWAGDFGNGFADLPVGQAVQALEGTDPRALEVEAQADHIGGFAGYMAGYATLDVAPALLARIYQAYGLTRDIAGYPALRERQEIARRAAQDLTSLAAVFDAGHRVLLLGHHETAARCFEHVARTFPSREILNNAGVARALQALALDLHLDLTGERDVVYPFEVDLQTRLRTGTKAAAGSDRERQAQRLRLLQQARQTLDQARMRDPSYAPVLVNLACLVDLLGEPEEAVLRAGQALRLAGEAQTPVAVAHAYVARGIARLHLDPPDSTASRRDLEQALAGAPLLARMNLDILDGEPRPAGPVASTSQDRRAEEIAGRTAADHRGADAPLVGRVPRDGLGQPTFHLYRRRAGAWSWLVVDTGYNLAAFLETGENYDGATARGLRIGDEARKARDAYGPPGSILPGPRGRQEVFARQGLAVRYDEADRVRGWLLFHTEE